MEQKRPIRVLVTAGPTRAYLDDVRFISNLSTGETAFEICHALKQVNALVALVVGPSSYPFDSLKLSVCRQIQTNDEMQAQVTRLCRSFRPDVGIFAAAVVDFAPTRKLAGKYSTLNKLWRVCLRPTRKIIDGVRKRHPRMKIIGFKLEPKFSSRKRAIQFGGVLMKNKNLDGLVLNYASEMTANRHPAFLFSKNNRVSYVTSKRQIANWVVSELRALSLNE